jgi:hypothetical protein
MGKTASWENRHPRAAAHDGDPAILQRFTHNFASTTIRYMEWRLAARVSCPAEVHT